MARSAKVREAVRDGVDRWREVHYGQVEETLDVDAFLEYEVPSDNGRSDTIAPLPRRKPFTVNQADSHTLRTMRLSRPFRISRWLAFRRLFVWMYGVLYFVSGVVGDTVRRQDSVERRAVRLRQTFSQIGGTFIKFGQQMAIRVDLLPYVYCDELTKLLDRVEPFPSEQAIAAVERVTGKPLSETFQTFDPVPIGSASVACVYQAVLLNGDRVAVKVRRPNIGELFEADFLVLKWLSNMMEFLTLLRPGFTENILQETHDTILEELDFYKESRFQEIFCRRAKEAKRKFFTAPDLYPEISGEDVIVQEFVSGIWMFELLAAVENHDEVALAKMRRMNIDPKVVARRLMWVSHWGLWESSFFHADPHPANLIVQPNNQLVFIDFGSMGTLTESRRMAMHRIFTLEEAEDLEGITRVSLTLLEPLPPLDLEKVLKAIEGVFWEGLIATRSEQSEWWERTSAQLWLGFFRVTSRFQIPMSFDTVRMIRATLLYDTLAARLDNDIDVGKQYRRFMEDAGGDARTRVQKRVLDRLENGLSEQDYVTIERLVKMGEQAVFQGQRLLNLRTFNYSALVGKFVSTVMLTLSLFFQIVGITAVITFVTYTIQSSQIESSVSVVTVFRNVIFSGWYQLFLAFLVTTSIRRILFRLGDKEV